MKLNKDVLKWVGGLAVASVMLAACNGGSGSTTASTGGTSASGSGGSGSGGKKITMGFSQVGAESGWRTANTQSIQSAAKDAGIDLKFSDAQQKQENQIKAIRAFIAEGVDIIAFSPVTVDGWKPVLEEAKAAHIPVIISDRTVNAPDDLYVTFMGSDFLKEGHMAGDWLAKKMNGQANIAELTGTPGSAPANDRHKGFEDAIAKYPGMKIVFSQTGEFTREKGKATMEALLKSSVGSTVNALFSHNDDMCIGAIQAMEESGKKPGKDIVTVSVDGIKPIFQAMVDGKANCTVECNPLLGPLLMQTAKDVLAGKKVEKKILMTDGIFDQTQAAKELPNRKY